jgi:acetyl-CoA carboxylase biotin carboxylase subunit
MFEKLLIANRGEIACRIIRTCNHLGIKTVAIYSKADTDALHVRMADEAYAIGPAPAKDSYLNIKRIIKVAKRAHVDAIHPGYGFLSENPEFIKAVVAVGITFIGPSAYLIEQLGNKVLARDFAEKAKLPVIPATPSNLSDDQLMTAAESIGYPLMVKAVNGGGGMGIRFVKNQDALFESIVKARTQALNAFGDSNVYLEGFIQGASHVEVQILGDHHGNLVHMFERDCSLQRRHQKVLEETPCSKLTAAQRKTITSAAIRLGKRIGYTNAGTVEFLVIPGKAYYFLEVNTRLQVEHPVTEMITGIDMVELQIRVSAGQKLPISQAEIKRKGHALEIRVYPEDPDSFLPVTGIIKGLSWPEEPHIRVDSALEIGYEIKPYYEALMAKLIVWGKNRADAIENARVALNRTQIQGVVTNIPAIKRVLTHADYLDNSFNTEFLENLLQEHTTDSSGNELVAAIAVAILMNQLPEMVDPPSRWKRHSRRMATMGSLEGGYP